MQPNKEPARWRDCIDPMTLPLRRVHIVEVLGYPHAANQVFYCRAQWDGQTGYCYLKYAAHADANLRNEVRILQQLAHPLAAEVLEYDAQDFCYVILSQRPGRRLSVLLQEDGTKDGSSFMQEYGRTLATLHQARGDFPDAPHRRFHETPDLAYLQERGLNHVYPFLTEKRPSPIPRCFVHGDCHYANLLWQDGQISAVLDFELAGLGDRDFDIAWALILRPGQQFLKTQKERDLFLTGYRSVASCDLTRIRYFMVMNYARFLRAGDEDYAAFVRREIDRLMSLV